MYIYVFLHNKILYLSATGLLRPEITVKYFCVAGIFFISGLSLKSEQLYTAVRQYRLHGFIQGFTLFMFPLLVQLFVFFIRPFGLNEWIIKGLVLIGKIYSEQYH